MQIKTKLVGLVPKMNSNMNDQLDPPFIEEELWTSVFQMCPTKVLGPNGLPIAFFFKALGLSKVWCHLYLPLYLE